MGSPAHSSHRICEAIGGCGDELEALLGEIGYQVTERRAGNGIDVEPVYRHPDERMAVFVGDGPEYTLPEHLERLRERGVAGIRSLAHREFALGVEALERFTRKAPLRRVHECVFGVLALESEPVDPRL